MKKHQAVELTKEIASCNNIQMAKKISLNSAYGAIGNQYFRYYKLSKCGSNYFIWSGFYSLDRKPYEQLSKQNT